MTTPTRSWTELDLLRAHAHASVRTETRLAEMRGAKMGGRQLAHHEYVAERDARDSFLKLWRRLFGDAQLLTLTSSSTPAPAPPRAA